MKKFILTIAICFITLPAFGESISNKELVKACKDKKPAAQNFCYGFIISAANGAQFYRNIVDPEDSFLDICFPENISNKEVVAVYLKWIEDNPTVLDTPAFVGVSSALSTKYSCAEAKEEE